MYFQRTKFRYGFFFLMAALPISNVLPGTNKKGGETRSRYSRLSFPMGYVHCHFVDRALSLRVKLQAGTRRHVASARLNLPRRLRHFRISRRDSGSKRKKVPTCNQRDLEVTVKYRKNEMEWKIYSLATRVDG